MPDVKACRTQCACNWINQTTFGGGQAYAVIGSQPGVNQWRLGGATGTEGFCLYTSNTVVKVRALSLKSMNCHIYSTMDSNPQLSSLICLFSPSWRTVWKTNYNLNLKKLINSHMLNVHSFLYIKYVLDLDVTFCFSAQNVKDLLREFSHLKFWTRVQTKVHVCIHVLLLVFVSHYNFVNALQNFAWHNYSTSCRLSSHTLLSCLLIFPLSHSHRKYFHVFLCVFLSWVFISSFLVSLRVPSDHF